MYYFNYYHYNNNNQNYMVCSTLSDTITVQWYAHSHFYKLG